MATSQRSMTGGNKDISRRQQQQQHDDDCEADGRQGGGNDSSRAHELLKCGCCGEFPSKRVFETDCCGRVLCGPCAKPTNRLSGRAAPARCPCRDCRSPVFWCHRSRTLEQLVGDLQRRCHLCGCQCARRDWRAHFDACPERRVECRLCRHRRRQGEDSDKDNVQSDRSRDSAAAAAAHRCRLSEIVDHLRLEHSLATVQQLRSYYDYCQ